MTKSDRRLILSLADRVHRQSELLSRRAEKMADVKIQGIEDVQRLLKKEQTWEPPASLPAFLELVGLVIATSK